MCDNRASFGIIRVGTDKGRLKTSKASFAKTSEASFAKTIKPERNPMEKKFLDILVCPVTKGRLEYHQDKQELWSRQAKLAYPIKDGIPYMLENEARALSEEELKA